MRSRPITRITILSKAARRASTASARCLSTASSPIRGGSIRFLAMFGNGAGIRSRHPAFCAGVPGTSVPTASARPCAAAPRPTTATTLSASVLPERSSLWSSLHLYDFGRTVDWTALKGVRRRRTAFFSGAERWNACRVGAVCTGSQVEASISSVSGRRLLRAPDSDAPVFPRSARGS
jgi:hypothetical protein